MTGVLGAAMEREHHEIDEGIERFSLDELSGEERADSLKRAIDALRRHIFLEEEFLFPPMKADLAIPMMVMLREHGEIWRSLEEIEAKLAQGVASEPVLRDACQELLLQLDRHNSKEEPIFYGAADETLSDAQTAVLQDLLRTGEMPEGWVCQQA